MGDEADWVIVTLVLYTWSGAARLGQASPKGAAGAITTSGRGFKSGVSRRAAAGSAPGGQLIGVKGKPETASPRVPTDAFTLSGPTNGTTIVTGTSDPETSWVLCSWALGPHFSFLFLTDMYLYDHMTLTHMTDYLYNQLSCWELHCSLLLYVPYCSLLVVTCDHHCS